MKESGRKKKERKEKDLWNMLSKKDNSCGNVQGPSPVGAECV